VGGFFTDDIRLTFANARPATGRENVLAAIEALYDRLAGLHHSLIHVWHVGGHTIVESEVTYDRKDGLSVSCPAVSILHLNRRGLVDDYRIFVDLSPLDS
jgi:hypothetical protein